jgi:hypothetical protein
MNDEAKSQLAKILGDYDAKLTKADRVDAANRAAEAAFPERFRELKAQTLRPALQEVAEMLNGSGHEASVLEQEESSSVVGGVRAAAVSLRIVPKPFAHKSTVPNPSSIEITFAVKHGERRISVSWTSTLIAGGGGVGKRGEYELEGVTSDVIVNHVTQALNEAFGGDPAGKSAA